MAVHKAEMAPEDTAWDASAEVGKMEGADQLKRAHAWVDDEGDPELKGSYKFPHHLADGRVVWAACANAMARLDSADIPTEDKEGVYQHIAAHYVQFEKEPPERGITKWKAGEELLGLPEIRSLSLHEIAQLNETARAIQVLIEGFRGKQEEATPPPPNPYYSEIFEALNKLAPVGG